MKAITIFQPWTRAIASGHKLVENRGRPVYYLGPIAIHAGKRIDGDAEWDRRIVDLFGRDAATGQPLGAVIAVAAFTGCHLADTGCCSPWGERFHGGMSGERRPAWHYVLADVRPLTRPVYVRGQQAVPWTLPPEVAEKVTAQLDEEVV